MPTDYQRGILADAGAGRGTPLAIRCGILYSTSVQVTQPIHPMTTATYSHARENLAKLWDQIEDERTPVVLQRRGHADMALLPADELASLQETAHLLRSPKNAARLLTALARSLRETEPSIDLEHLRAHIGLPAATR